MRTPPERHRLQGVPAKETFQPVTPRRCETNVSPNGREPLGSMLLRALRRIEAIGPPLAA
jgi:hypothetical protein